MPKRYYIDTSIWMDLYEDRRGYHDEPLGNFAFRFFSLIKTKGHKLAISDILLKELSMNYSLEQVNGMMKLFENIIEKIISTREQCLEARKLSENRRLPYGDALHAILARDHDLILITRDNDFRRLADIAPHWRPEDII